MQPILPLLSMMVMVAVAGPTVMVKNSTGSSSNTDSTMLNSIQLESGILVKDSDVVMGT